MLETKKWILLVEDEPDLVESLSRKFTDNGFAVISCSKTIEAFVKLKNQKFNCIVLDIRLPGGSGEQIIEFLRNDKRSMNSNANTPIIVTSGHLDANVVQAIRSHISAAFVKPFDPELLVAKIRGLCQAQPAAVSSAT